MELNQELDTEIRIPTWTGGPVLNDQEEQNWRDTIERSCGLHYPEDRLHQLHSSLLRRMRQLRIGSFEEYRQVVERVPQELNALLESMMNYETGFFRQRQAFAVLSHVVLPNLLREKEPRQDYRLTAWSAGCSTGQEAYSLAMTMLDAPGAGMYSVMVTGSDISRYAIDAASYGSYPMDVVQDLPPACVRRYFTVSGAGFQERCAVNRRLRNAVEFRECNLCDASTYGETEYDVILCQNVLCGLRAKSRRAVVEALAARLKPGGYLLLGLGEVEEHSTEHLDPIEVPGVLCLHDNRRR